MQHATKQLSIVIVSWNTRDLLAQCLRSLEANVDRSLQANLEIYVVDNHSRDGSQLLVKQEFPYVNLLENDENIGFARANNQAFRQSCGRYILLLNSDTRVCLGGVDALLAFMESNPQAGAAGSLLLNADGSLQTSCYPAPTLMRELWRLLHLDILYPYGIYRMEKWSRSEPKAVAVAQGASLMVRREVIEQVGMLDEDYFVYTEEVDWCYRMRKAGWGIFWVPTSKVVHYGGQSTKQVATEMFLQLYQTKILYFRKQHGRFAALLYKLILLFVGLVRVLLNPLAWLLRPACRPQQQQLAGFYRRLLLELPTL